MILYGRNCNEKEKYLLLDFSKDSLVNFKNVEAIYCLLDKGLFIMNDDEIKIFSASFRAYVFDKKEYTGNLPDAKKVSTKFHLAILSGFLY